jgi:hypothetical protein
MGYLTGYLTAFISFSQVTELSLRVEFQLPVILCQRGRFVVF